MSRHLSEFLLVVALGLSGPVWADHLVLLSVNTEAEVRDPLTTPMVEVELSAELQGLPPDPIEPIGISWQERGGVEPEPFLQLSIPSDCLASDFMAECVMGEFVIDGASTSLTIREFDARFLTRDDRTLRFDLLASFLGGDQAHAMLSILGGRTVELTIGEESATALITGIEAVSGVQPEPFQPALDNQ